MAFGTSIFYLGIAIVRGSISAIGLVFVSAAALLTYIRLIEEKEMELRFGDAYRKYKERTPFIVPRLRGQR